MTASFRQARRPIVGGRVRPLPPRVAAATAALAAAVDAAGILAPTTPEIAAAMEALAAAERPATPATPAAAETPRSTP